MKRAVIPGSYDPITKGHTDLIERAASLFDEVVVAIFDHPDKKSLFSLEERIAFIEEACREYGNVKTDSFCGLLIDYVKEKDIDVIVRGVRNVRDFDYEYELSQIYAKTGGSETVLLPSRGENAHVSSSMVRELIKYDRDPSQFLPFEWKQK